jgi:hypothetical protein
MSLERRARQAQREHQLAMSEPPKKIIKILRRTRKVLLLPGVGIVIAAFLDVSGPRELQLRSLGLLAVVFWLSLDLWGKLLEKMRRTDWISICGVTITSLMLIAAGGVMWWWLDGKLADQREEVSNSFSASYRLVPGKEDIPTETSFTVVNNSKFTLSKRNKLLCYVNDAIGGSEATARVKNVWERNGVDPLTGKWQGTYSLASTPDFFWDSMVDASPIEPGGDATTDECLKVIGFEKTTQCIDVTLVFLYTLDTQPDIHQERDFRYVGTMQGKSFFWKVQPVQSRTRYCEQYYGRP